MANKILIPTPLRPFTGKQDAVEVDGATIGELLANLTTKYAGLKPHLYNEQGKLRSFVNVYLNDEDIRYLEKEKTAVKPGDTISIIPSVGGWQVNGSLERRSQALQPASHHAGGGRRRAGEAQEGQRALHRRGRPRLAGGAVSGRGRRRHDRHRRFRRRRFQQPAAAGDSRHVRRRTLEARVGEGSAARAEPAHQRSRRTRRRCRRRTRSICSSRTTSSSTAPTIFRRAISPTTRACCSASRTRTAASSGSKGRRRCSRPRTGRAIAACIRSRRRRAWCRAAPKAACSACCRASSARFRRPKRSS